MPPELQANFATIWCLILSVFFQNIFSKVYFCKISFWEVYPYFVSSNLYEFIAKFIFKYEPNVLHNVINWICHPLKSLTSLYKYSIYVGNEFWNEWLKEVSFSFSSFMKRCPHIRSMTQIFEVFEWLETVARGRNSVLEWYLKAASLTADTADSCHSGIKHCTNCE